MKYAIIAILILFSSSMAYSQDTTDKFVVYSTSAPFYGTEMVVEFNLTEIKNTQICKSSDKDFPIKQSDAISKALRWAKEEFDPSKKWEVYAVSLKFLSIESCHCVYLIELRPENEMQTLNVGLLMNGKLIAPVAKKK